LKYAAQVIPQIDAEIVKKIDGHEQRGTKRNTACDLIL